MQNEYIDLPINVQETPKHLLQKAQTYKVPSKPQQAVNDLLTKLQSVLKGTQNDLYIFYHTVMISTYKQHFTDKQWLAPNILQQQFNKEYKPTAQTIYKQFAIRTSCTRYKNIKIAEKYWDMIDEAWQEYTSIFKLEWTRVNFPPEMIWDYFDSFLQIYIINRAKSQNMTQTKPNCGQFFNIEQTKQMFKQISKCIPSTFNQNVTSKEIFGYYSLIALAVLSITDGKYKQALSYISRISLKEISILSKSMGCLLTTFFIASFSNFMIEQCYKSVKLCQLIIPFYQKYRKYYDKSFSYSRQLLPLYQKLVILQCINYIFLQQKPKTATMQIFKNSHIKIKQKQPKDKISDCFFKMKQNDLNTFYKLFNFLIIQYSIPNVIIFLNQIQKIFVQKFKNLQLVNINTIIQNYKRIQLSKMQKLLNLSKQDILKKIKSLNAIQITQSPWDITIINPLLKQKKVNVLIQDDIAIFDSQNVDTEQSSREWRRYREQISWLNEKVKIL